MCHFLSAVVLPNGDIICRPETDAHQHLRDLAGVNDRTTEACCCVEYTPSGRDYFNLESYRLVIDQDRPSWFSEEMEERVRENLSARVQRALVTEDQRVLIGGAWLIAEGVTAASLVGGRVIALRGTVQEVLSGGTVQYVESGGTVQKVWSGGTVQEVLSGGTVQEVLSGGTVQEVLSGGTVQKVWSGGTVQEAEDQ